MSFRCEHCRRLFNDRSNRNKHLKICHKKPDQPEKSYQSKIKIGLKRENLQDLSDIDESSNNTNLPDSSIIYNYEKSQSLTEIALKEKIAMLEKQLEDREKIIMLEKQIEAIPQVVNVNVTNINNTINLSFNDHMIDLFSDMEKLHGSQKGTQIVHNAIKDKTKHNKFNSVISFFNPNIFSKVIKYAGKDQHGDDQYQCLENEKLVTNNCRKVDKVFTDILTNGVLKASNKAINDALDSYDPLVEDSVSTTLVVNYDGIYGNPKNDAMSSIEKFRNIVADPKHIRNTVEKITQSSI